MYLTVKQVATRLQVSSMTIYRMCHAGTMPTVMVGSQFRIPETKFNEWLEARSITAPTPEKE